MNVLSSESPNQRTTRRISKPQMERRRRERINHSLEKLRLLMVENTQDENLKNPKAEKAEILESVVQFLKTGKKVEKGQKAVRHRPNRLPSDPRGRRAAGSSQDSYRGGMRSCLLRVSRFMANKNQGSMGTSGDAVQASQAHAQAQPSSSGYINGALIPPPVGYSGALSHPHLMDHHYLNRPMMSPAAPMSHMHVMDPVWRPWPM